MTEKKVHIQLLIRGCQQNNRQSQKRLYEYFYGYVLNVALRYSRNREEAVEVLNDAFYKAFKNIDKYDPAYPFKTWIRRITVNAAIDYHRKYHSKAKEVPIEYNTQQQVTEEMDIFLDKDFDSLPILQKLSPAYRMVFSLFVIEEYKHHEIAEMLNISASTSRSNLLRAKKQLKKIYLESHQSRKIKEA